MVKLKLSIPLLESPWINRFDIVYLLDAITKTLEIKDCFYDVDFRQNSNNNQTAFIHQTDPKNNNIRLRLITVKGDLSERTIRDYEVDYLTIEESKTLTEKVCKTLAGLIEEDRRIVSKHAECSFRSGPTNYQI